MPHAPTAVSTSCVPVLTSLGRLSRAGCRAHCGYQRRACRRRCARLSSRVHWREGGGQRGPQGSGPWRAAWHAAVRQAVRMLADPGCSGVCVVRSETRWGAECVRCVRRLRHACVLRARRAVAIAEHRATGATLERLLEAMHYVCRVCNRWTCAFTLDRGRFGTLNVRARRTQGSVDIIQFIETAGNGNGAPRARQSRQTTRCGGKSKWAKKRKILAPYCIVH